MRFCQSQWPILRQRWWIIATGVAMQYVHGIFTQLAHRMHTPAAEPLHDLGFDLIPVRTGFWLQCNAITIVLQCSAVTAARRALGVWLVAPANCFLMTSLLLCAAQFADFRLPLKSPQGTISVTVFSRHFGRVAELCKPTNPHVQCHSNHSYILIA